MRTTVLVHWRSLLFRVCLNWVEKMWMSCLRWFVIVTGYCCRDADDCFHVCSTNGGCFANKQQVEELYRRLFGSMSMIEEMNGVCCREGQPSADHCHGRRFTKDGSNRKHNFFESDVHCGSRFSLEIVDKVKRKRNWQDVVLRAVGRWNNSCLIPSWEDNKKNLSCLLWTDDEEEECVCPIPLCLSLNPWSVRCLICTKCNRKSERRNVSIFCHETVVCL